MDALKKIALKWKVIAVVVAVASVLCGWYFTLRVGMFVGDTFYYRISGGRLARNSHEYILKTGEDTYFLVSDFGEKSVEVTQNGNDYLFTFSDGENVSGTWNGVFLDDGSDFPFEITVSVNNEPVKISNRTYATAIVHWREGEVELIGSWILLAAGLVIYLLGLASMWFPEEMHFLFSRWQYANAELSAEGKLAEQFGGLVLCGLGVAVMSGIFLLFIQ